MSQHSLRRRLLIAATLLLLVFLGLMGVALNSSFKQSVLSNAEDALRNQVLLLMANIDVIDDNVVMPSVPWEARLSQTDSSLFAQISSPDKMVLWRSESLLGRQLPILDAQPGQFLFYENPEWPGGPSSYVMSLGVSWETEHGDVATLANAG